MLVLGWCLLGERCAHWTDSGALSLAVLAAVGGAPPFSVIVRAQLRLSYLYKYREESLARFALKGQTARLVHAPLKESHQSVGVSWVGVPHAVGGRLQTIITHVPTGPRDQIILFIRAPLEDRNLPPHQEKPRAHPRPPSEGRSPGERRSAGER